MEHSKMNRMKNLTSSAVRILFVVCLFMLCMIGSNATFQNSAVAQTLAAQSSASAQSSVSTPSSMFVASNEPIYLDDVPVPNVPTPCTIMFHGFAPKSLELRGEHQLHVTLYSTTGSVVHEETLLANIKRSGYDISLVGVAPQIKAKSESFVMGIAIDSMQQILWPVAISAAREFKGSVYLAKLNGGALENQEFTNADTHKTVSGDATVVGGGAIPVTMYAHQKGNVPIRPLSEYSGVEKSSNFNLKLELGIAGPQSLAFNANALMDYGRASVDLLDLVSVFGAKLGLGVRAIHSAQDFRSYAAGIVANVNNDGSVLATIGITKYQTGPQTADGYNLAPFMRLQYFSSPKTLFVYSEVEAAVHIRGYLSGTAGLGMQFLGMQLIAGYQYSLFVQPNVTNFNTTNGFSTMLSYSF
jgi:hypothetical protein